MNENPVAFQGKISQELLLRAQWIHSRRLLIIVAGIFLVVAAGLFFFGLTRNRDLLPIAAMTAALAVVGLPVLCLVQRWQSGRVYRRTPYLAETMQGEITSAGVRVATSMSQSEIPWSQFTKFVDAGDVVLLYRGPNMFSVFASDFFAGPVEWERAKAMMREHVR